MSIDGGGIRGLYTASYLDGLAHQFARRRGVKSLDVGKGFDLIVGTSTGGIIACALAAGVPLRRVADLYRCHAKAIFPEKVPGTIPSLLKQLWTRRRIVAKGAVALEQALHETFGDRTIGEVYEARQIALAIPAVEMTRHRAWIFKTAHLGGRRDDFYRLVDACLATTAAPIYRSMAYITNDDTRESRVFVDGGLWANNPVLVAILEALRMVENDPEEPIDVFSLGTCKRPEGDVVSPEAIHRGFVDWKMGAEAAAVSIDAQESAFDYMAAFLCKQLSKHRRCQVVRFPHGVVSAAIMEFLDLDENREAALNALVQQAQDDVSETLSCCDSGERGGGLLARLFNELPVRPDNGDSAALNKRD